MRISYSSFDTYNRCPLKYKLQYVDWVKVPLKAEFFFGSLIHEVIQHALRRDPIIPGFNELIKFYESKWSEAAFADSLEVKQYFELGRSMIKSFHENYKPGLRKVAACEKRFQIPLGKHVLSGVIDRVDKLPYGAYELIDYKTGKTLPSQEEVDVDKQLGFYNLAATSLWPEISEIKLTLHYLKFNSFVSTNRMPSEMEEIKKEIIKTADTIEKDKDYKPKKNQYCPWCEYRHLCPLQKDNLSKEEKFQQIGKEYLSHHEKLKDLEKQINNYFDENKLSEVSVNEYSIVRSKDRAISVAKVKLL